MVSYLQTDKRWNKVNYSARGEKNTIGAAGCGPTSAAMVIATLVDSNVNPVTCANWSMNRGYKIKAQGTSYEYLVPQLAAYGIVAERVNTSNIYKNTKSPAHNQALEALKNGDWLIACMGKGLWTSSGHYIVVEGYENGFVNIKDPASTKASRLRNTWVLFSSQVKYYWIVRVPEAFKKKPAPVAAVYTKEQFIFDVCTTLGATTAQGAFEKTISISQTKNKTHALVTPLERYMKAWGLYTGAIEADQGKKPVFGKGMGQAFYNYQKNVLKYSKADYEITARGKMWKEMLGL